MSTIYTPELLAQLKQLGDNFEQAIRRDERQRLLVKFRAEFPATGNNTDMHGQPLRESGQQPDDVVSVELNATHRKMLGYLRDGFMAVPTLAGHCNIKKQSVYTYLGQLEQAGYKLEKRSTGNRRGGYRLIYRLAKAA
jgi:mRNA-degrading endonuclease RelE of RelBE toxin-antitoxin system